MCMALRICCRSEEAGIQYNNLACDTHNHVRSSWRRGAELGHSVDVKRKRLHQRSNSTVVVTGRCDRSRTILRLCQDALHHICRSDRAPPDFFILGFVDGDL